MSNDVAVNAVNDVAANAEGNALLSAARAAGPTCLNMLLWGAAKAGDRDAVRVLLAEGGDLDREWCHPAGAGDLNPLCVAAKEGHQEVVKEMLSDVTRTNGPMAIKALPFASGSGNADIVELLLKEVPREVLRGSNEAPRAVVKAAQRGHLGVVERLLEAGLDVDLELDGTWNSDGYTPLQVACMCGRKAVAEYLLTAGADINKASKSGQRTPPFLARSEREVVELLPGAGAEVDRALEEDGVTPLFAASIEGHPEVVKLLLGAGADLDRAVNRYPGATRLHWASKVGLLGMVRSLLEAEADVNSQMTKGRLLFTGRPGVAVTAVLWRSCSWPLGQRLTRRTTSQPFPC